MRQAAVRAFRPLLLALLLSAALCAGLSPAVADCGYRERKQLAMVGMSPDGRPVFLAYYRAWVPVHFFDAAILSLGSKLPPLAVSPCDGTWYVRWPGDTPANPQEPDTVYRDDARLVPEDIGAFHIGELWDSDVAAALEEGGQRLVFRQAMYEPYSGLITYTTHTFVWDARERAYQRASSEETDCIALQTQAVQEALSQGDTQAILQGLQTFNGWSGRTNYAVDGVPESLHVPLWAFMAKRAGELAGQGDAAGAAAFVEECLLTADTLSEGGWGGRNGEPFIAYSRSPETEKAILSCLGILRDGGRGERANELAEQAGLETF